MLISAILNQLLLFAESILLLFITEVCKVTTLANLYLAKFLFCYLKIHLCRLSSNYKILAIEANLNLIRWIHAEVPDSWLYVIFKSSKGRIISLVIGIKRHYVRLCEAVFAPPLATMPAVPSNFLPQTTNLFLACSYQIL